MFMEMKNYLKHYNHNHDSLGRFTSSDVVNIDGVHKDAKDYIIKKGTKIDRVSTTDKEINVGRTYGTFTDSDKKKYLSVCKDWLGATHKMELATKKDVKVAGKSTQAQIFSDLLKNNSIEDLVRHTVPSDSKSYKKERKEVSKIYKNAYKNQESFDKALFKFNQGLSYGRHHDMRLENEFYKKLSQKGYDAAVDLNDLNFADSPVIFIKREDSLELKKVSEIKQSEIDDAEIWLRKKGYII